MYETMTPTDLPTRALVYVPEFARAAGLHPKTVLRLLKAGKLPPANRVGRQWTWPRSAVMAFLGLTAPTAAGGA